MCLPIEFNGLHVPKVSSVSTIEINGLDVPMASSVSIIEINGLAVPRLQECVYHRVQWSYLINAEPSESLDIIDQRSLARLTS